MTDSVTVPIQPQRLLWQEAVVEAITVETPSVKTFRLRPPQWPGFRAGQHVDVRLTAPDGYQAERSYSIASAPEEAGTLDLTIEELENGEVSPFFHEVVEVGDTIELRGPIGGHFIWEKSLGGPILLIAGGSGLVPLMSILRHRAAVAPDVPAVLVYSARRYDDMIWREELFRRAGTEPQFKLIATLTREAAAHEGIRHGRIDAALMEAALAALPAGEGPKLTYICGSTPFVETAATLALGAGLPFASVRTERYGGMGR
ncbi:ferredoxin reductase [Kaistia dalseonensis]|uniref:Ferredoxin-NADP reductase n=1 Tax=Kaistia dalseonensis TaxID=410840 RepID=A0ABU0H741_9HYPH|nr:ferredoxin reductase [Kaistia dalseonensis]MCX5495009.1 ferredoxin reductase [Kaistia dalseonensis]MDQ0437590.1 ferredoxin-NADP reductase [Kaistia dalseonensis]